MALDLEALGITQEELQDRVVAGMTEQLMGSWSSDDEGNGYRRASDLKDKLDRKIQEAIDAAIERMAEQHVYPGITQMVENLTLQQTTKWGEKKGEPLSFTEYLTQRADAYLREDVNHQGKTQAEDSYSWRKHGTRIAYLVDSHLQFSIQRAMDEAVKNANESIKGGLEKAVKNALDGISAGMKLSVTVKS